MDPAAYPHTAADIACIETHMSWVFLTGIYAYKVKKPIQFEFVDFSQLSLREFYCRRELDLNSTFAPEIYLDVVPICTRPNGLAIGHENGTHCNDEAGEIVDWAVKMLQFPAEAQCDRLLQQGALPLPCVHRFGADLATQHAALPVAPYIPIERAALENFHTLRNLDLPRSLHRPLEVLQKKTAVAFAHLNSALEARALSGRCRACHGDLHLGNMVLLGDTVKAFDCLEFNDQLSQTDVWADVAFLFMDLATRGYSAYAYALIDGYLSVCADYEGAALLNLFSTYRAMVRAKVTALRHRQQPHQEHLVRISTLVNWACDQLQRPPGRIIITHGLSGSGKSFWSKQLVEALGCIRIRSDLLRKSLAGLSADASTDSGLGANLYSRSRSIDLYAHMAELAIRLAGAGELVIVDAASLFYDQRQIVRTKAESSGIPTAWLCFHASSDTLRERLKERQSRDSDPSEADESVLQWQIGHQEGFARHEPHVTFDTETGTVDELLQLVNDPFTFGQ